MAIEATRKVEERINRLEKLANVAEEHGFERKANRLQRRAERAEERLAGVIEHKREKQSERESLKNIPSLHRVDIEA